MASPSVGPATECLHGSGVLIPDMISRLLNQLWIGRPLLAR